eukprot:1175501-Rhodomonas_salina.1
MDRSRCLGSSGWKVLRCEIKYRTTYSWYKLHRKSGFCISFRSLRFLNASTTCPDFVPVVLKSVWVGEYRGVELYEVGVD